MPNCEVIQSPNFQSLIHEFSIVASSISMTGMSSLMGYTRLQVSHLSAVPSLTRVTGVLQFGHDGGTITYVENNNGDVEGRLVAPAWLATVFSAILALAPDGDSDRSRDRSLKVTRKSTHPSRFVR